MNYKELVDSCKPEVDESMVVRKQGGRTMVSAEAAIKLARELAAKRKPGEKATGSDLSNAAKLLRKEEHEVEESFTIKDHTGKTVHVAYTSSEAKRKAEELTKKTGKEHKPGYERTATVKTEEVEAVEEGFVVKYHDAKGNHKNTSKVFDSKEKAQGHAARGNKVDAVGGKYTVHTIDAKGHMKEETEQIEEISQSTLQSYRDKAMKVQQKKIDSGEGKSRADSLRKSDRKIRALQANKEKEVQGYVSFKNKQFHGRYNEEVELEEAKKHPPGVVGISVNHSMSPEGKEGNKYTVYFKPGAKSPLGRTKAKDISHHKTAEEAHAAKADYVKKHSEHGVQALKGLGEEVELDEAKKKKSCGSPIENAHDDKETKMNEQMKNAFDWKGYIDQKKKQKTTSGDTKTGHEVKHTSTGTVYTKKANKDGEYSSHDEKKAAGEEPVKRGRGRPAGSYGSYKERSAETKASAAAKSAASKAANRAKLKEAFDEEFVSSLFEEFSEEQDYIDFDDLLQCEEFEQLDELSKKTLGDYVKKASLDIHNSAFKSGEAHSKGALGKMTTNFLKSHKRQMGTIRAVQKMTKEDLDEMSQEDFDDLIENFEQLDELSKTKLKAYVDKAVDRTAAHAYIAGGGTGQTDKAANKKEFSTAVKRIQGVRKATTRLAKEDVEIEEAMTRDQFMKGNSSIEDKSDAELQHHMKKKVEGPGSATWRKLIKKEIEKRKSAKNEEVEQIDELSNTTLKSYIKKAKSQADGADASADLHRDIGDKDSEGKLRKYAAKRNAGADKAASKVSSPIKKHFGMKEEVEQIEETQTDQEVKPLDESINKYANFLARTKQ
jgi:hypothetical protein